MAKKWIRGWDRNKVANRKENHSIEFIEISKSFKKIRVDPIDIRSVNKYIIAAVDYFLGMVLCEIIKNRDDHENFQELV